jgi:hypothetical protein
MELGEIGHWQRTLGRHIWFLRSAGITSVQIRRDIARQLGQYRNIRGLSVPGATERMVHRILVHWQHESAYLDNRGGPRALRFEGHSPTFRSLVRAAVPGADASAILGALKRHRLVSHNHGVVRLLVDSFFPRGGQRGFLLSTTLASLEALTDTCFVNLRTDHAMRFHGRAYTEYLDRRHLKAYQEFLNESAQVFLMMHEAWLKRHEVKGVDPRRKQICRMGVGVFAIRSH